MGRKRNQGKARKAAKAKAKQEAEGRDNEAIEERRQPPAAQLQQVQSSGNKKCYHGHSFDPLTSDDGTCQFVRAFLESFEEVRGPLCSSLSDCLIAAKNATMDEYVEVWSDSTKLESAISFFLHLGTQDILEGEYDNARNAAAFARYFEQYIFVYWQQAPLVRWNKIYEAQYADQYTLVKFFRKRIPCSCLDEKYKEVKNITKMGLCFNKQCSFPNGRMEYSKTMYCDRCRCATYCSRECQKVDYSRHRSSCEEYATRIAEFGANTMKQS